MSGPYDITRAQWAWIMAGFVVVASLSLLGLWWHEKRKGRR